MNKWELAHHFVMEELLQTGTMESPHAFNVAKRITQRLVDEGVITSTVENDLRGDVV